MASCGGAIIRSQNNKRQMLIHCFSSDLFSVFKLRKSCFLLLSMVTCPHFIDSTCPFLRPHRSRRSGHGDAGQDCESDLQVRERDGQIGDQGQVKGRRQGGSVFIGRCRDQCDGGCWRWRWHCRRRRERRCERVHVARTGADGISPTLHSNSCSLGDFVLDLLHPCIFSFGFFVALFFSYFSVFQLYFVPFI